jgi:O-antigen/teichoic acid export membrane protein
VETLPPEEYGLFSLTLLPVVVVASFAGGIAGQPMLRFATVLSAPGTRHGLAHAPLLASLTLVPLLLLYLAGAGRQNGLILLSLGLVPSMALLETRRNYLVALARVRDVFLLDVVRSVVSIIVLVSLMEAGIRKSSTPLTALFLSTATCVLLFWIRSAPVAATGSLNVDKAYLRYGFWVASWLAMVSLFPFLERFILSTRYGMAMTGTYSMIADPLSAVASASGSVIVSAFMPKYVAAWNANRPDDIKRLSNVAIAVIVLIGLLLLVAGVIIGVADIGKYGGVLRTNGAMAATLLAASTVWQATIFFHKPLELRNQTRSMFLSLAAVAAVFVIIVWPLIGIFGAIGVALAKLVAGIAYAGIVARVAREK